MRSWFRVLNVTDPSVRDILVFDVIADEIDGAMGFGLSAKAFADQVMAFPDTVDTIRVHINSPGGDAFGGLAIANVLRDQHMTKGRTVEAIVEGIAASAASVVAMGAQTITMGEAALMMIHLPYAFTVGTADELQRAAEGLNAIRDAVVKAYQWHSSLSADELVAMMTAETWMSPDEAIANGFATAKAAGVKPSTQLRAEALSRMTVPSQFRERVAALARPDITAIDVIRACKAGGCEELAEELVSAGARLETVQARIADVKSAKAAAFQRERDIRGLCKLSRLPQLAESYVAGGMPIESVKAQVVVITALIDQATGEIDTTLLPEDGGAHARRRDRDPYGVLGKGPSASEIYKRLNSSAAR